MKNEVLKKLPKDLILAIKAEYPKRTTLHDALDRGETSVEWQLRSGAEFKMTAQEVVDCFKKWRPHKIYQAAQTCLRRETLLAEYLKIRPHH